MEAKTILFQCEPGQQSALILDLIQANAVRCVFFRSPSRAEKPGGAGTGTWRPARCCTRSAGVRSRLLGHEVIPERQKYLVQRTVRLLGDLGSLAGNAHIAMQGYWPTSFRFAPRLGSSQAISPRAT